MLGDLGPLVLNRPGSFSCAPKSSSRRCSSHPRRARRHWAPGPGAFHGADRRKVERASAAGHLHMRDAAAAVLGVREADFVHLVRAGLLTHSEIVEGQHHTQVRLYRQADLDRLARSR